MNKKDVMLFVLGITAVAAVLFGVVASYKVFNIWAMDKEGQALLAKAEQTRQIQIAQARAEKDAAVLRAEAIAVIGKAAKEYPEYRQQEYIGAFAEALKEGKMQQIIYIPTEAGIPILESHRLQK